MAGFQAEIDMVTEMAVVTGTEVAVAVVAWTEVVESGKQLTLTNGFANKQHLSCVILLD